MKYSVATLAALLIFGCGRNRPPAVPEVRGPQTGRPGDTLLFTAISTDPEDDDLGYKFDPGDTGAIEWTPFYASGRPVARHQVYADTGSYRFRVKARDSHGRESDWSEPRDVLIALLPPARPRRPTGPASCTTGVSHEFMTLCLHPQGESIRFQFDWGGDTSDWGRFVLSGEEYSVARVFDTAGRYRIAARAGDRSGLLSDWSDYIEVPVMTIPGAPPRAVRLAAATDSTLLLSWAAPDSGNPAACGVFFRSVNDQGWLPVARLGTAPVEYVGCRTGDGCHALLKVTSVRVNRGDVRFQGAFQRVPGLRLVRRQADGR